MVHIAKSACTTSSSSADITSEYGSQSPRFAGFRRNAV